MEVVGTSFSRTGTYTLKLALEQLGYGSCYHNYELRKRPNDLTFFSEAYETGTTNWKQLYKAFNAVTDWPASSFWESLYKTYPSAKFIHVDRDPDKWFDSFTATIIPSIFEDIKSSDVFISDRNKLLKKMVLDDFFEGQFDNKDFVISKYLEHRAKVKKTVPKSQVLFFSLDEEWPPLCEFLNVSTPQAPFPSSNNKTAFWNYHLQDKKQHT